jgi:hypothetical protein
VHGKIVRSFGIPDSTCDYNIENKTYVSLINIRSVQSTQIIYKKYLVAEFNTYFPTAWILVTPLVALMLLLFYFCEKFVS